MAKKTKRKQKIKEETEQEILKLIGNKILDFERKILIKYANIYVLGPF